MSGELVRNACCYVLVSLGLSMTAMPASAPENQGPMKNTVLDTAIAVEQGERIFATTCALCHGHRGAGGQGRPLAGRTFDAESWFNIISKGQTRGSNRMPPYENSLSEEQRWQLIAYLKSLNEEN